MTTLAWRSQQPSGSRAIHLTTVNVGHSVRTLLWHFNIVQCSRRYPFIRQAGRSLGMPWCLSSPLKATFSPSKTRTGHFEKTSNPLDYGLEGRVDRLYHLIRLHVLLLCDMEISLILANLHALRKYSRLTRRSRNPNRPPLASSPV